MLFRSHIATCDYEFLTAQQGIRLVIADGTLKFPDFQMQVKVFSSGVTARKWREIC